MGPLLSKDVSPPICSQTIPLAARNHPPPKTGTRCQAQAHLRLRKCVQPVQNQRRAEVLLRPQPCSQPQGDTPRTHCVYKLHGGDQPRQARPLQCRATGGV